jgi:flagellar basal-body rod protein FlgF
MAILGNNLSNAGTPGYKQDVDAVGAFPKLMLARLNANGNSAGQVGPVGTGAGLREEKLDLAQGKLAETGKELDLALAGRGFFAVQTPDGVRYTRDGAFQRSPDGQLVTAKGYQVLGEGGPIALPEGPVSIAADGAVSVGGQQVGKLQVTDFPDGTQLDKAGDNLLAAQGGAAAQQVEVKQGLLEGSNFDAVNEMVDLMAASRAYQTSAQMLQITDGTLQQAVSDIGKV